MKKELRIFLIILIGWLALLDFAILRNVITKSISNYNAIIVKNLMSGAAVYYPTDSHSMFNALVIPMIIFNALVIIFLSLSYYFWIKSKNRLNINKKISGKRGQAAMEFMMTYGWAVMALVVSISALAYFGVFTNFSPTGKAICALSPGFDCKEFVVGPGGVMMTIQNSLGVNINTVSLNITNSPQGPCNESMPPKNLGDGASDNFYVPCLNIGSIGQQFKGDIVIKYKKENSVLNSIANGMINTKTENYTYNDTEAPIIDIIEPSPGQTYSEFSFNLVYTVKDYNISYCHYKLDNGPEIDLPNCDNKYNINSGDVWGMHTITLYAKDMNNNTNNENITFNTINNITGEDYLLSADFSEINANGIDCSDMRGNVTQPFTIENIGSVSGRVGPVAMLYRCSPCNHYQCNVDDNYYCSTQRIYTVYPQFANLSPGQTASFILTFEKEKYMRWGDYYIITLNPIANGPGNMVSSSVFPCY
jgi:hypothetical protein